MRVPRVFSAVVLVGCSLAPAVAYAQGEAAVQGETKVELGLRTGFGLPLGKAVADADDDMSDVITGQIPLWLDFGARIQERVFVGAYFSYGFGLLGGEFSDACDEAEEQADEAGVSFSCSTSDMRLGAQAIYHFGAPSETHPWLGGGIGYEWWRVGQSVEAGGQQQSLGVTGHGFEFLNVQVGGDFPVGEGFAMGPFMAFTFSQFGTVSANCSGVGCSDDSESEPIDDKTFHYWLFLGVRVAALP